MEVHRKLFPHIMLDNEEIYFQSLTGVIESVDEFASLEITKVPDSYHFRVAPSLPKYTRLLLEEILKFHNLFGLHLDLGKSIKTSSTISFNINISN